jgi:hypothetical protein
MDVTKANNENQPEQQQIIQQQRNTSRATTVTATVMILTRQLRSTRNTCRYMARRWMPQTNNIEEQSTKIKEDNVSITTETTTMKNVIDDRTMVAKWTRNNQIEYRQRK